MNPFISAVALPRLVLALSVLAVMTFPAYAGGGHHGELSDALNPLSPEDGAPTGSEDQHNHNHNEGAGPVGKPAQPSVADRVIKVGLTDEMKINFRSTFLHTVLQSLHFLTLFERIGVDDKF